jgi:5-methylcytosine-specific restriction enzyme A
MVASPKSICPQIGCMKLTNGGRCEQHKRTQHKGTSKNRPGDPFYSSTAWIRLRDWKRSDRPLCEECEASGVVEPMAHVDHVLPRRERPDLELDASNLRSLCARCHNRKTAKERKHVQ